MLLITYDYVAVEGARTCFGMRGFSALDHVGLLVGRGRRSQKPKGADPSESGSALHAAS